MPRSWPSVSATRQSQLGRLMQLAIIAALVAGVVRGNPSVVVNGAIALFVTFLPAILERDHHIALPPSLGLWITGAVLLHAVGMLGLYSTLWWWDHVTHTLSASVVAGVGYTTARVLDIHSDVIRFPPEFLALFVLLFTIAFGVLWEVLEFGSRALADAVGYGPFLVQYGLTDTIVDLLFDMAGALLVAAFGARRLAGVVEAVTDRLERHRQSPADRRRPP